MNRILTPCSLLACLFLFIPALSVSAQSVQEARTGLLQARQQLNQAVAQWDIEQMHEARGMFERLLSIKPLQKWTHYYLGYADYRMSLFYQPKDRQRARQLLDRAIEHLKQAIRLDNRFAEAYALLSSCLGQKIQYEPASAMFLGPQSAKNMQAALALEPQNPRVVLLNALRLFFTPPMFGGSTDKGLAGFRRATELFARFNAADSLAPDWGHEEAFAWLGLAYQQNSDSARARQAFDKALAITPDYRWVKEILLPNLTKNLQQKHQTKKKN
ncbi:MAG: hypothetical protein Q9P14_03320 [candidate division KSB1 bacterium]|nr:hypothetical protein [candidate division KSB1 bacterium]MDQ7064220.1 hypothetical protein [candidate division KSB1 bacterium]